MRRSMLLLPSLAFLATAFAQQPSPASSPRVPHLPFGLQGSVHTVMTKSEQLRPDPRPSRRTFSPPARVVLPALSIRIGPSMWLSFDEKGRLVEQGSVSPDGKLASLTRNQGDTSITTVRLPGRTPEISETRRVRSTNGRESSTEIHRDGQLTQKIESRSSGGNGTQHSEHQTYDTQGKLLSETSLDIETQKQDHAHTATFHTVNAGPDGVTRELKMVDRYNAEDNSREHSEYAADGALLCTLRVSGTALVYSTIFPEAKSPCHIQASAKEEPKRYEFSLYPNGASGELFTDISTYSDMQRYFEPDTVERLDASSNVIDKVSIRYERDEQGNWTTRVISVLDPTTKDLVEIERDTRTITYYDPQ